MKPAEYYGLEPFLINELLNNFVAIYRYLALPDNIMTNCHRLYLTVSLYRSLSASSISLRQDKTTHTATVLLGACHSKMC